VTVRCLTRDDLDYSDRQARTKPENDADLTPIARPEATPLPSQAAAAASLQGPQPLFRDEHAPPLSTPPEDAFVSYDAPVQAPPGRFLWLVFDLRGASSKTPRLRSVRVEFPGHDLLQHLPKTLWREDRARDFLRRYLAPIAATLGEWGDASATRHRLLDPRIARADALEWLGSLVGLAIDPCWPERARRDMLRSAVRLFRIRGTPAGLCEMITILTGAKVVIVELFKLRSGGVFGNPDARLSRSVLGAGFRVGGNVGATAPAALPAATPPEDYAHRFTVIIVAQFSDEQLRCVRRLIETHKPAHTIFDVCLVNAGTRVGVGLHVGVAAVIGHNSGFDYATLGDSVLGKGYLLGRPSLERGNDAKDTHDCAEVTT
jgi:phage tail-like protein